MNMYMYILVHGLCTYIELCVVVYATCTFVTYQVNITGIYNGSGFMYMYIMYAMKYGEVP